VIFLADEAKEAPVQNPMAEMCQGPTGFLYALAFMFLMMIMINRDLGDAISEYVGVILMPVIGFQSKWPLLTMVGAGLLTITISTTIRHFTMDWMDLARKQRIMNAYNKELRQAQKDNNQSKVERLQEQNADIMSMQSQTMMTQMKASIFSMVIAILIFRWMYTFIATVPQPTATTPWDISWPLTGSAFEQVCGTICMGGRGFPYWILLYMTITIPIGQALMRGLKFYEFRRKLKEKGEDTFGVQPIKSVKDLLEGDREEKKEKKESPKNKKESKSKREQDREERERESKGKITKKKKK
jgi:uncharacterized membrane protein (DUF106 family)